MKRVAIIFDDQSRPETTGGYCLRALHELASVEHFLPGAVDRLPRNRFDLFVRIDDGLDRPLPDDLRPCVWWAIDTHLDFGRCLAEARRANLVFAAQRDGTEELRRAGISGAIWLPLACDPTIHHRYEVTKQYDVGFVGNLFPGPRTDLLERLRRRFPNTFIGRCFFEEMARAYSAARTVFNRSIRNDVNMRVFEALACGSLLLSNDLTDNGQAELFRDGVHLATYVDAEELLDKVTFYLARPELRSRVEAEGMSEVSAKHTYRLRMERLLAEAEKLPITVPVATANSMAAPTPRVTCIGMPTDPGYFEHTRPELLACVPAAARDVLDVGCGAGQLGAALKARQPARVVGLEMDRWAAAAARQRLDEVIEGDVEGRPLPFADGSFDCVICGDVLEHLRDPLRFLRRVRGWLRSGGKLVASLPNVRHHSVVRALLEGHWTYEPAGLLDCTHLRFFTRREVEKLFYRSGFMLDAMKVLPGPEHSAWEAQGRPGEVRVGGLQIGALAPAEAEEFYAYQYLAEARVDPPTDFGLTSMVLLVHNELAFTRQCVASIRLVTDEPYELIFVDNASTDGTRDYLRLLGASDPRVRVIVNDTNRGFPAGANQGVQAARGGQVLLLNNDTVVTTGWLRRLLRALHADPAIGLAGPCSNCVSGEQQVPARYDADLTGLDGFAWDWGKAHDAVRQATDRLVGFCLLIRRDVIDRIGLLDERFGLGCFEDDDYCRRTLAAGFRAVIACDAFVHHFGGRTFVASGVDFAALMRHNQQLFREKWEPPASPGPPPEQVAPSPPRDTPAQSYSVRQAAGGGLLLQRGAAPRPQLSLCMIVRDNARTLGPCLESIKPWVDEMVVVDTGSRDNTPQIAEQLGADVFHFPWCDSFSAARNESLQHAHGAWVFWMDSDDTIDAVNGRKLRDLADREADPNVLGYIMQVHCPGPGDGAAADVTIVDHVKLLRNRPDLRFEGRIHEQILPAIRRASGETAWTDIFVLHSGYDHTPEGQRKKLERDLRLLHLELQEQPDHPFTLFNLGMTYADQGVFDRAAGYLRQSIDRASPGESHLRKAYALLVYCLGQQNQTELARESCLRGLELFPADAELRFRQGLLLHEAGRLEEAARSYEALLHERGPRYFSSMDRGIRGYKARQNLAVVYTDLGNPEQAEVQWRQVVEERPDYLPGWQGLGEALLTQRKLPELRALAEHLTGNGRLRRAGLVFAGRLAAAQDQGEAAQAVLVQAVQEYPGDPEPLQALARFLFERHGPAAATAALEALARLCPEDPAAYHNLGLAYSQRGQFGEAIKSFRHSLQLRPESADTHLHLGHALWEAGQEADAARAWQQVLVLRPTDAAAQVALRRWQATAPPVAE